MPVEIRELQITTIVDEQPKPLQGKPAVPDKNTLVAECVEQVLEILKQKNDR